MFPFVNFFQCVISQIVIAVYIKKQLSFCQVNAVVDSPAFAAVFFFIIANGKIISLPLPCRNHFFRVVRGAVVYDQPFKVPESLPLQRAVQVFNNVRPIKGRRKNGNSHSKFLFVFL